VAVKNGRRAIIGLACRFPALRPEAFALAVVRRRARGPGPPVQTPPRDIRANRTARRVVGQVAEFDATLQRIAARGPAMTHAALALELTWELLESAFGRSGEPYAESRLRLLEARRMTTPC